MDIQSVLQQLHVYFDSGQTPLAGVFLEEKYEEALAERDKTAMLHLLNELIGYYREVTDEEGAIRTEERLKELLLDDGFQNTVEAGTSYLNMATGYRFLKMYDEASTYYDRAGQILREKLPENDMRLAGLYNNQSILLQARKDYVNAAKYLMQALRILEANPEQKVQEAVTYTNLAQVYIVEMDYVNAEKALQKAEELFDLIGQNDWHYPGFANARAIYYESLEKYDEALAWYEIALDKLVRTVGMLNDQGEDLQKKIKSLRKQLGKIEYASGMELSRAYFETYGLPMLEEKFPDYKKNIAAGLMGEGSECLGYDDVISADHDMGPGFALFLAEEDYEVIGQDLQEAYAALPLVFAGRIRNNSDYATGRTGVCIREAYFTRVLGGKYIPKTNKEWMEISEDALRTAISGEIFLDESGVFTKQLQQLKAYYPYAVWQEKLARALLLCAQSGAYNYKRMLKDRNDPVAAYFCLQENIRATMQIGYLLNYQYAPYYKWIYKGMEAFVNLPNLRKQVKKLSETPNDFETTYRTMLEVAADIVEELHKRGLSESDSLYLEDQAKEVMRHTHNSYEVNVMGREETIKEIVLAEWDFFDKTKNEGGRASCQNNFPVFSVMRKSQYMTWPDDMLQIYLEHLRISKAQGRNLITEKYGRMMESTAPEAYDKIKDAFQALSPERVQIQEAIVGIQVGWMEEFAAKYPKMAGNARSIHTAEDTEYNTSYETYLRGELGTYSDELMEAYGRFIVSLAQEGKNLAYETMENTAHLYGYKDVPEAEEKL